MLDHQFDATIPVTDLKQWAYCPRVFYYHHCLPRVRPVTTLMEIGAEAGCDEEGREERRSLRAYGLTAGEREFSVSLRSERIGLRGVADMVITAQDGEIIPIDYKFSQQFDDKRSAHFRLQLAAYALMLEEQRNCVVRRGFIYLIPLRRAEEVRIDQRLRRRLQDAIEGMRQVMLTEQIPPPTPQIAKCASCEFRRFCNDVL